MYPPPHMTCMYPPPNMTCMYPEDRSMLTTQEHVGCLQLEARRVQRSDCKQEIQNQEIHPSPGSDWRSREQRSLCWYMGSGNGSLLSALAPTQPVPNRTCKFILVRLPLHNVRGAETSLQHFLMQLLSGGARLVVGAAQARQRLRVFRVASQFAQGW